MKKIWVFIMGVITGVVLLLMLFFFISMLASSEKELSISSNNGITLFSEEGEFISEKPFKVFQALDQGYALASGLSDIIGGEEMFYGVNVLFHSEEKYYYDEEIIRVPKGKCIRQVGIYKYPTKDGNEKTVPIVKILDK